MARECGQCLVREIPASVLILHASFIIAGLIQLRERARGHFIHTRSIVQENTAVRRGKVSLFGLGCGVCGRTLRGALVAIWQRFC